mgnify:CR=1 FL=1
MVSKHVPKGSVNSVSSVRDKTSKDLCEQPYRGKLTFSSSFHIFPSVSACWLILRAEVAYITDTPACHNS